MGVAEAKDCYTLAKPQMSECRCGSKVTKAEWEYPLKGVEAARCEHAL